MCSTENGMVTNEKVKSITIDGCKVTLRFSDKPQPNIENTIIDILMESFETRMQSK